MAITSRQSFLANQYRYKTAKSDSVKADYPDARVVTMDTQLSLSDAATLATAYLNEFKYSKKSYSVTFDGLLTIDDLKNTVPSFTLTDPTLGVSAKTGKLVSMTLDHASQTTTVVIRVR